MDARSPILERCPTSMFRRRRSTSAPVGSDMRQATASFHAGRGRPAAERRRQFRFTIPNTFRCRARGLPDSARRAGAAPARARHPRLDPHGLWRPRAAEIAVLGLSSPSSGQLRRRRLAGARSVGHRRHLPDDARHQRASLRAEEGAATRSTRSPPRTASTLKFAGTPPDNVTLDSNMQSDLEFLGKLAQNFSNPEQKWEFYARADERGDKLHFRPRSARTTRRSRRCSGAPTCSASSRRSISATRSRRSRSTAGTRSPRSRSSASRARGAGAGRRPIRAATSSARAFGKETVLELRFPVKSKQEADQRAAAELAKRTNDLVKGEGETFGFPELLPDTDDRARRPRQPSSRRPTT